MICALCHFDLPEDSFRVSRGYREKTCCQCRLDRTAMPRRVAEDAMWLESYREHWATIDRRTFINTHDEQWVPCAGYEGLYEVSNRGRVRSLVIAKPTGRYLRHEPLILVQCTQSSSGYALVTLATDGRRATKCVHALVAASFYGPRPDGHVAGHRDGCPSNNHATNIEWITYQENEADKARHGRAARGERNGYAKVSDAVAAGIRAMRLSGASTTAIAAHFGVTRVMAWRIATGRRYAPPLEAPRPQEAALGRMGD
jgi:hypothetical protein